MSSCSYRSVIWDTYIPCDKDLGESEYWWSLNPWVQMRQVQKIIQEKIGKVNGWNLGEQQPLKPEHKESDTQEGDKTRVTLPIP